MKKQFLFPAGFAPLFLFLMVMLMCTADVSGQMNPPGYERAVKMEMEKRNTPRLDRDSLTVVDTAIIYDPETYRDSMIVVSTTYSIRDYVRNFYALSDADILLDGQPHVIIDPNTFEEIMIRLTPDNKIEVRPNKE